MRILRRGGYLSERLALKSLPIRVGFAWRKRWPTPRRPVTDAPRESDCRVDPVGFADLLAPRLHWRQTPRVVVPLRTPPGQECSKGRRALPGTRGVPLCPDCRPLARKCGAAGSGAVALVEQPHAAPAQGHGG